MREVDEEPWKNLAVYPVETLAESYDPSEAQIKNQEYCAIEAYLENMSHQETKKNLEYERALRDKLMEYLWDGQAASYSHLQRKFADYSEDDLNANLSVLCWAVRGYFTLKGCIRYQRDLRMDMARDKVIAALNELVAPNVPIPVTKRDAVAKLASLELVTGNWLLLEPEGDPVDNEVTQDLSNRLANRAETLRHRTLSKSPSRSPGRAPRGLRSPPMESRLPPSAVDVKLERREDNAHSVNGTAQPVIKKERRSGDATSLQNDQNGQGSSAVFVPKTDPDQATSRLGSSSPGIFVPQETHAELDAKIATIVRFLGDREPPIMRKSDLMSALNLHSIEDLETRLSDGGALIAFPHCIAYCGREEDAVILETMAKMVHAQGKFRKAAVFATVQESELPIDVKGFDATLRRYCYSQGQFWYPKPK